MFMMFKTMLGTSNLEQGAAQKNPATQLPPEKLLLRSLRSILKHDELEQGQVDKLLARARMALDALPLATVQYAQAAASLENAHGYFQTGVSGAARYELRTLYRNLRNSFDECENRG